MQLLVDHGDAGDYGVLGTGEMAFLAVDQQAPAAVTLTSGTLMTRKNQAELVKAGG